MVYEKKKQAKTTTANSTNHVLNSFDSSYLP